MKRIWEFSQKCHGELLNVTSNYVVYNTLVYK